MADPWDSAPLASPLDVALDAEGASPQVAQVAQSIYQQESGKGRNTKTSNAGATGGMQIIPATFNSVADQGWSIHDPVDNARAGVRYIQQLSEKAGGDPALTAAGYYGGPGAIAKAKQGIAVSDPRNPNAPNTLQYGAQVAARIPQAAAPQPAGDAWWSSAPVVGSADATQATPQAAPQQPAQAAPGQAPQGTPDDPQGYGEAPPSDNTQFALPGQQSPAQIQAAQDAQQPQKGYFARAADEFTDSPLGAVVNAAHGVADNLSYGLVDKAGAALNAAANFQDGGSFMDRYHSVLDQAHQQEDQSPAFTAGQLGSVFVPGAGELSLVNKAMDMVPTASKAARVVAGGAAGMTEGAAQVLGHATDLNDVTPGQLATGMGLGALGGGVAGAFTKPTDNQLFNSFVNKAGSAGQAQHDAEIIGDLQALKDRAAQGGASLGPADANALASSYTQKVADALRQQDKTPERQTLLNALGRARSLNDNDIAALRQVQNGGNATADAIQKYQRTMALTSPTPANTGMLASGLRMLVDNGALHLVANHVPGGGLLTLAPVRKYLMGGVLGGRENRTANIASALEQSKAAQIALNRLGPSQASQSTQALAQQSAQAVAARQAAAQAAQAAATQRQAASFVNRGQQAAQAARQANAQGWQQGVSNFQAAQQAAAQSRAANAAAQAQAVQQARSQFGNAMQGGAQLRQQATQAAAPVQAELVAQQKAAQAVQAAQAKEALKTTAAQRAALADQQASDPSYLLGMSNQFGPPRNPQEMAEFSKLMQNQAQAAAVGPQAPAVAQQVAAQQAAQKVTASRANAVREQQIVSNIANGNFDGLTFQSPATRMMLAHLDTKDMEAVKSEISRLAKESPDTHGLVAARMLSSSPSKFNYLPMQDQLASKLGGRMPSAEEKAAIMGRQAPQAAPQPSTPVLAQATGDVQNPLAYKAGIANRQAAQKNAQAAAQDPEVKKLITKMSTTSKSAGRAELFNDFMSKHSTAPAKVLEAKRLAEPLVTYGK